MGGGKGNIKPEDGKQFSKDYQPEEKWTEKKALRLGEDMINWLILKDNEGKDVGNILFEEFLVIEQKLYPEIISYLKDKFTSFLKLYELAKKIQEVKMSKYGLADRLNSGMCKFLLSATHGLKEKSEIDQNTSITWNEEKTYE